MVIPNGAGRALGTRHESMEAEDRRTKTQQPSYDKNIRNVLIRHSESEHFRTQTHNPKVTRTYREQKVKHVHDKGKVVMRIIGPRGDPEGVGKIGDDGTWDSGGVVVAEKNILEGAHRMAWRSSPQWRTGGGTGFKTRLSRRRWLRAGGGERGWAGAWVWAEGGGGVAPAASRPGGSAVSTSSPVERSPEESDITKKAC